MSIKDFTVASFDGLELVSRTWLVPEGTPLKARILFLHGFSEFLDAYNHWFPVVAASGYEVTMYDQRGFGSTAKKPDDRGRSNEFKLMKDIDTMVSYMLNLKDRKDYPLVLWGFSMGGCNCINYMTFGTYRKEIDLYISGGPFLLTHPDTNRGINAVKMKLLPWLARFFPNFADTVELRPENTTNNPEFWTLYREQPLRHTRTTAEYMNDAVNRGHRLLQADQLTGIAQKPLLLCHGEADQVCDVEATKKFLEIAPLEDKTIDLYPGMPHELQHCKESDRLDHWRRVRDWLDSRVEGLRK